ncbi:tetraspanin-11-like [Lotus japonicus]|uniref:tetraspanin-11-like n=1 Tax=Lotus japonicus TaxID=34305 RepID=UPI00258C93A2|nr:tetraspanin-11-like [Lotus japonicus]
MFRTSNTVVGFLNILSLLLGLTAVVTAAYIHQHGGSDCQKVLQYPLLIGGVFVVLVSTLGIAGSLYRINTALYAYLVVTFLVVVGLAFFTVFALFVTNRKVGQQVSNKGYGEYRVTDFSHWLQRYVVNDKNWDEVKSCLVDAHVCQNLAVNGGRNNDSLIFKHLSTTQSGCCKPPVYCGFRMKNATFWEVPKNGPAANNSDCKTWDNKQDKLCYDCNACKGGVLANIRNQWRHLTIFNGLVLALVTTIYVLGCYAIKNNRWDLRREHQTPAAGHP